MNTVLRKKWLFTLVIITVLGYTHASAQTEVKGRITKSDTNDPLQGVTVVEVNQNDRQVNGTNTDAAGTYSLKISNPSNRLRFSFIGFITKTENIGGRSVINVLLEHDSAKGSMAD